MVPGWFFMVFHGYRSVFMVFYGIRKVFHGSRAVFMVFHGPRLVFHGSRSAFMGFHGSMLVFHGTGLVFHGFSPDCTRPNCILARRSSLGPPPGGRHRT